MSINSILADSHLHLQDERLLGDLDAVLQRARQAGVERLVVNGSEEQDWPIVWRLARRYPEIVPCFGLHPWYVQRRSSIWLEKLEWFLSSLPSAVGEIGLDKYHADGNEPAQAEVFLAQLDLARRLRRPVMIHCLHAWERLMESLAGEDPLPAGSMIHAYSGSAEMVRTLVAKGLYISFAATFLPQNRNRARHALGTVPRNRLLLETDAPNLPLPEGYRSDCRRNAEGKRTGEPADLAIIFREAARVRKEDPGEMAAALWENSNTLLRTILP